MSITRSFSTSQTTTTVQGGTNSGTTAESSGAQLAATVSIDPGTECQDGLGAVVAGDATALGDGTLTAAIVDATVANTGSTAAVDASATLFAVGTSAGDFAFATAMGGITLFGSTDVVFRLGFDAFTFESGPTGSMQAAASIDHLVALDFAPDGGAGSLPSGSVALPLPEAPSGGSAPEDDGGSLWVGGVWSPPDIDGNLSVFDVSALAFGEDSFVDIGVAALAMEYQFSTVSVATIVAIA